jgi:hypothetical protein
MKKAILFLVVVLLCGCNRTEPTPPQIAPQTEQPLLSQGTRVTPTLNTCRAYFSGGGWYLLVSERVDANNDGKAENVISFRHPIHGTLEARIAVQRSTYTPATRSAEFWGVGKFRGKGVVAQAIVTATGGFYGRGTTRLQCWEDANRNSAVDWGEPQIFPSSNPISNQQTQMSFASAKEVLPQ